MALGRAGVPLPQLLPPERIAAIISETRSAGDLVVELAKRSSAYYAPSAAIAELADSVHMNLSRIFPVSLMLDGEYGLRDAALSVPAIVGEKGVSKILTPELTREEKEALAQSARLIASVVRGGAA